MKENKEVMSIAQEEAKKAFKESVLFLQGDVTTSPSPYGVPMAMYGKKVREFDQLKTFDMVDKSLYSSLCNSYSVSLERYVNNLFVPNILAELEFGLLSYYDLKYYHDVFEKASELLTASESTNLYFNINRRITSEKTNDIDFANYLIGEMSNIKIKYMSICTEVIRKLIQYICFESPSVSMHLDDFLSKITIDCFGEEKKIESNPRAFISACLTELSINDMNNISVILDKLFQDFGMIYITSNPYYLNDRVYPPHNLKKAFNPECCECEI